MSHSFHDFEHAGWDDLRVAASYHRNLSDLTTSCIPELFRLARLKRGDRTLDVACGAGYVAAKASDQGAETIGLDFAAAQIRLAEQTYPGMRFIEGDAGALPFPSADFDVVFNAFGLPHMPDPAKVVAEAYRVLKPAGRFAYASWAEAAKCVAFSMIYDAIRTCGTLDVGLPPGPNFFSYGDPKYAEALLDQAGFVNVTTSEVPLVWRVDSPDVIIDAILTGTVRASAALKGQSPDSLTRIKQYMRERIAGFAKAGMYQVPAPALVVAAVKPD
ncbi:MAG: methyltransferase domain-containing protein [Dongiaceae bacterium]